MPEQAEAKNLVSSERTLVSGVLTGWDASAAFPLAEIRASLGQAGDLATETKVRGPNSDSNGGTETPVVRRRLAAQDRRCAWAAEGCEDAHVKALRCMWRTDLPSSLRGTHLSRRSCSP